MYILVCVAHFYILFMNKILMILVFNVVPLNIWTSEWISATASPWEERNNMVDGIEVFYLSQLMLFYNYIAVQE